MSDLTSTISNARFTPTRLREGYDMGAVDAFLERLVAAARSGEDLAPLVAAARFTTTKLREGYDMGEVDHFLATVAAGPSSPAAEAAAATEAAPGPVVQEVPGLLARLFGRR